MKIRLGRYNDLPLLSINMSGDAILDGGSEGELTLDHSFVRPWMKQGQPVHVFAYVDYETDEVKVTREHPLIEAERFAYLEVAEVYDDGYLMDWGVEDYPLFVPKEEARFRLMRGGRYVIYAFLDGDGRLQASARIEDYLDFGKPDLAPGDRVKTLPYAETDLGYKCILNDRYLGVLYANELMEPVNVGEVVDTYVKRVREDYKIDLSQSKVGFGRVEDFAEALYAELKERGGVIALGDQSPADAIYDMFGVSKKTFKKAVGTLYRNRLVTPYADRIVLNA